MLIPDHFSLADYHGEQYELALACETRLVPESPGINVNRHFLADLLLTTRDAASALKVLEEGLSVDSKEEWLLRMSEAEAHWQLGNAARARQAAKRSLELAPSDAKRHELRERLAPILENEA